jgi:transposase
MGVECVVVAPSLVPQKTGSRVKTDPRDAAKLARYLRSGDLTAVYVPDEIGEAMRDLVRARADAKKSLHTSRQQLNHLLLRHGRRWDGKSRWTQAHLEWLGQQHFDQPAQECVLSDYIQAVQAACERIRRYDDDVAKLVGSWSLSPLVTALQALRGVSVVSAAVIAAELGDLKRFASPGQLMAYVGLVPSEHSSGKRERKGGITRTGNAHARFVIVEAAWAYRFPPRRSEAIRRRQEAVSSEVQQISWRAQQRLYRKYTKLLGRRKNIQQTMTAVARELVGFIWAIGQAPKLVAEAS